MEIELATERVLWTTTALPGEFPFEIDLTSDGSTVLAHRFDGNDGTHWLLRLDAATGKPRGEPLELPGLRAVSPRGETAAAVRKENGEERIELHEVPSGRRLVSWRSGGSEVSEATINSFAFRFSPDERSLFGTVRRGGILYQDDSQFSQIWDAQHGQPISPIMASTTRCIYTPAADRILTNTNNLWLLRRAADGQAMGSGFSAGSGYFTKTLPDGLTIINPVADGTLRMWQISPEAEPIAEDRSNNRPTIDGSRLHREPRWVSLLTNGFVTDGQIAITNARGFRGENRFGLRTSRPVVLWEDPLRTTLAGASAVLRSALTADT
jgi:hypothetical protein